MTRRISSIAGFILALSCSVAAPLAANTPVSVDVERGSDSAYIVEATFEVNAPAEIVWQVLTDYEGMRGFVSSLRHSTIKEREPGRVVLEQQGVGRAWIVSVPMHVVLDVREQAPRTLAFRDLCGKSFTTYEGRWELTSLTGRTHVRYHLKADPTGRQPAMVARSAIRGSVQKLLNEVKTEILERSTR